MQRCYDALMAVPTRTREEDARSPFVLFEDSPRGGIDERMKAVVHIPVCTVQCLGYLVGGMTRQVFLQGGTDHVAPRPLGTAGEPLHPLEDVVRNRHRSFHSGSVTTQ